MHVMQFILCCIIPKTIYIIYRLKTKWSEFMYQYLRSSLVRLCLVCKENDLDLRLSEHRATWWVRRYLGKLQVISPGGDDCEFFLCNYKLVSRQASAVYTRCRYLTSPRSVANGYGQLILARLHLPSLLTDNCLCFNVETKLDNNLISHVRLSWLWWCGHRSAVSDWFSNRNLKYR